MTSVVRANPSSDIDQTKYEKTKEALSLLFTLLEAYGPSWYTEDHREKALAVLS